MKAKNKKITMITGMVLGVTVLAGAAFASYNTSNGYDVGKTAIKGLMKNENYTANMNLTLSIDGSELANASMTELYDRNGEVSLNRIESTSSDSSYVGGSGEYMAYAQDGAYISIHTSDGETRTAVYKGDMVNGTFDEFFTLDEKEKNTTDKVIRFVELAMDTFVGDLKNNIVYVSGDDNSATYEINLDAIQIPEVVNAGLSALFSSMQVSDYEDPFMILGSDPIISNASLRFTVDNEGRLTDGYTSATMTGYDDSNTKHDAAIGISLKMSDYGTTVPQRVDISTLENVETYEMTADTASNRYESEDGEVAVEIRE